jgi:hypothetical protein
MKAKITDRPMFKKGVDETDVENVGIMQGFMDAMEEDDSEDEYEMDDNEAAKVADRRPNSPEILMNNLRGDMRSIDARVEELADLVGYNAAADTPEDVLALLQPVLAQQGAAPAAPQGGIPAAMPQGMPGMEQGAVPQGMPAEAGMGGIGALPTDQGAAPEAPVAMARGGYVQHFRIGTDEDGVTPIEDTSSYAPGTFAPTDINKARNEMLTYLSSQPAALPDLQAGVDKRTPLYEKLLGVDKNLSQAQMLAELGSRAFNYAANVDDQGNQMKGGSNLSRLAGSMRTLPTAISGIVADAEKQKRAVRGMAITATEKEIEDTRTNNAKLVETQRKTYADIVKSQGSGNIFGKGDWDWSVINKPNLLANWAAGKTTEDESNVVESALTSLSADRTETRKDPVTGNDYTVTIPGIVPPFAQRAMKARGFDPRKGTSGAPNPAQAVPGSQAQGTITDSTGVVAAPAPGATKRQVVVQTDPLKLDPTAYNYYDEKAPTLYNMSAGTGAVPSLAAIGYELPIIGQLVGKSTGAERSYKLRTGLKTTALNISKGVAENPRYAEGERKYIQSTLELLPSFVDQQDAYLKRLFAFDDYLQDLQKDAQTSSYNVELPADVRQNARAKAVDIHNVRGKLGTPLRFYTKDDPRLSLVPPGTKAIWRDNAIFEIN